MAFVSAVLLVLAQGMIEASMASQVNQTGLSELEKQAYMLPDGTLPVFCDPQSGSHDVANCGGCVCSGLCWGHRTKSVMTFEFTQLSLISPSVLLLSETQTDGSSARAPPVV